jgi:hypothetical protein
LRLLLVYVVVGPVLMLRNFDAHSLGNEFTAALVKHFIPYFFATFWMFGLADWCALKVGLYAETNENAFDEDKTYDDDDFFKKCEESTASTLKEELSFASILK